MKNRMKEKTLRAAALSLSTVLASTSLPLTVLAEEGNGAGEENKNTVEVELYSEAKAAEVELAESASNKVDNADKAVDTVVANDEKALEDLKAVESMNAADTASNLAKEDMSAVITDYNNADKAVKEYEDIKIDTDEIVDDASDVADKLLKAEEGYKAAVEDNTKVINNAKTINEAETAYKEIEKAAQDANASYEEALAKYDELNKEYELAVKKMEDQAKLYEVAVEAGNADVKKAAQDLASAKSVVNALEEKVEAAKKELDNSGMADIIKKEDKVLADEIDNYGGSLDPLFYSILNNYFVEKQYGATEFTVDKFVKYDNDSTKNYCKVTYKDAEGKDNIVYLNYLPADGSDYKNGMVIFEKTEVTVVDQPAVEAHYEYKGKEIDESEIKVINGKTYIIGEATTVTGKYEPKKDEIIVESSKTSKFDLAPNEKHVIEIVSADVIRKETKTASNFKSQKEAEEAAQKESNKLNAVEGTVKITISKNKNKYTYTINYEVKENRIIEEIKYNSAVNAAPKDLKYIPAQDEKTHVEYTNDTYEADKIANTLLDEYNDEDFRNYLNAVNKYDQLAQDLADANTSLEEAKKAVANLEGKITALDKAGNVAALKEIKAAYEKKLEEAKDKLKEAETNKNDIEGLVEKAKQDRDDVIKKLTPSPVAPAPVGPAPANGPVVNPVAPIKAPVITIEEEGTPLAPAINNSKDANNVTKKVSKKATAVKKSSDNNTDEKASRAVINRKPKKYTPATDEEVIVIEDANTPLTSNIVDIAEDTTPLAPSMDKAEDNILKTSWWWLLIIAVLGATGVEMYIKHDQKKNKSRKDNK